MSLSTGLPSAMLARIRATPTIVAAFGENVATRATIKFWADFAPAGTVLPWAVYEEPDGEETYMTSAGGHTPSIETGTIRWVIVGEGRTVVRALGTMLTDVLNDAPLAFAGGQLMELRARKPFFAPLGDIVANSPSAVARVLLFDYMLSRST